MGFLGVGGGSVDARGGGFGGAVCKEGVGVGGIVVICISLSVGSVAGWVVVVGVVRRAIPCRSKT